MVLPNIASLAIDDMPQTRRAKPDSDIGFAVSVVVRRYGKCPGFYHRPLIRPKLIVALAFQKIPNTGRGPYNRIIGDSITIIITLNGDISRHSEIDH